MKNKKHLLLVISLVIFSLTALTLLFSFNIIDLVKAEQQYESGTLLKSNTSSAVYYIDEDHKKYVFTDERTYYSWYDNFNNVIESNVEELDKYEDGGAVTIRPGTKLITHVDTAKVYAVEPSGILRHIPDEQTALSLYGDNWSSLVVDMPSTLFVTTYTKGSELSNTLPTGTIVKQKGSNAHYYIQDGKKRVFKSGEAFTNNKFRFKDALEIDISSYEIGTSIQGKEKELVGYGEMEEGLQDEYIFNDAFNDGDDLKGNISGSFQLDKKRDIYDLDIEFSNQFRLEPYDDSLDFLSCFNDEILKAVMYDENIEIKDDTIRETKFNCLDNLPEFMRITPSIKKTLELMVKNNLNLSNLNIEFKIGVDSVEETYYTFDFNYQEMIVIANTIDKGHREIYNFYSGCILDLDCNDGDDNTIDTCLLPSTEYASCKNEK